MGKQSLTLLPWLFSEGEGSLGEGGGEADEHTEKEIQEWGC